jgi:hypothetical protein
MSKTTKIILISIGAIFGVALLVGGGVFLGRAIAFRNGFSFNRAGSQFQAPAYGPGMMNRQFNWQDNTQNDSRWPFHMSQGKGFRRDNRSGGQNRGFGMGPGMMGGAFFNQDGNTRPYGGMMGRGFSAGTYTGEPATMEAAQSAFSAYLAGLNNADLEVHEVMRFSQNAYAVVTEKSTGKGAMELLMDYASGQVYPEIGPNHMWNQKYGMMGAGARGGFGCAAGCQTAPSTDNTAEMTLSAADAKSAAQAYLDANTTGAVIDGEGISFYGYYSFDYSQNGAVAGMLSVNGFSGQVWPHTWHGSFIDEAEME